MFITINKTTISINKAAIELAAHQTIRFFLIIPTITAPT